MNDEELVKLRDMIKESLDSPGNQPLRMRIGDWLIDQVVRRLYPTNEPREPEDYWADHPIYSAEDWRYEVANGDTRQGYWEWVASKEEENES